MGLHAGLHVYTTLSFFVIQGKDIKPAWQVSKEMLLFFHKRDSEPLIFPFEGLVPSRKKINILIISLWHMVPCTF